SDLRTTFHEGIISQDTVLSAALLGDRRRKNSNQRWAGGRRVKPGWEGVLGLSDGPCPHYGLSGT
ncbi:hypothetical protein BaRGS_00038753, partial [Batillaria attramentaria]